MYPREFSASEFFGVFGDHLPEHVLGIVVFLPALQRGSQLELDHRLFGKLGDRRLERLDGIVAFATVFERTGEPNLDERIGRRQRARLPEQPEGLSNCRSDSYAAARSKYKPRNVSLVRSAASAALSRGVTMGSSRVTIF
jgi:hypothetical protein